MMTDPPLVEYLLDPESRAIVHIDGGIGETIEAATVPPKLFPIKRMIARAGFC